MSDDYSGEEEKQGNLIEAFKIVSGKEGLLPQHFFEATKSASTRGHDCKLYRKASGTLKNNYFSARVVSLWNKLD